MEREPKIGQPSVDAQREYASVRDNDATIVGIPGTKKKYKIRWLRNGQIEKLSRLLIRKSETDDKDGQSDNPLKTRNLHARLLPSISLTANGRLSSDTGICGDGSITYASTTMSSCFRFLLRLKKKFLSLSS